MYYNFFVKLNWTKLSQPQFETFSEEVSMSDTSLFRLNNVQIVSESNTNAMYDALVVLEWRVWESWAVLRFLWPLLAAPPLQSPAKSVQSLTASVWLSPVNMISFKYVSKYLVLKLITQICLYLKKYGEYREILLLKINYSH